jgi:hypothetical protein
MGWKRVRSCNPGFWLKMWTGWGGWRESVVAMGLLVEVVDFMRTSVRDSLGMMKMQENGKRSEDTKSQECVLVASKMYHLIGAVCITIVLVTCFCCMEQLATAAGLRLYTGELLYDKNFCWTSCCLENEVFCLVLLHCIHEIRASKDRISRLAFWYVHSVFFGWRL